MLTDHRASRKRMAAERYENPVGQLQYSKEEDMAEHSAGSLSPGMPGICGDS